MCGYTCRLYNIMMISPAPSAAGTQGLAGSIFCPDLQHSHCIAPASGQVLLWSPSRQLACLVSPAQRSTALKLRPCVHCRSTPQAAAFLPWLLKATAEPDGALALVLSSGAAIHSCPDDLKVRSIYTFVIGTWPLRGLSPTSVVVCIKSLLIFGRNC